MNKKKIKRAIISVSDKSNLKTILPILKKFKIEIISSGGTFKKIQKMHYKCKEVSSYTEYSELLNGRVKTLHPKIHAGILSIRKNKKHQKDLIKHKIPNIDLVIVDLYPFEQELNKNVKFQKLIEYIDIGGPTLIRSAAKNFNDVTVISSNADYKQLTTELVRNNGATSIKFRKNMSAKAFSLTAYYDSVVSNYLNNELNIKFPEKKTIHGKLIQKLRYGENPHQQASLYTSKDELGLVKLHGKDLSYNNYNDIYSALSILSSLKKNKGTVIVKHANPCGVAINKNIIKSFQDAIACDPVSAYGGVIAINSLITKKIAIELNKKFFEVIIADGFQNNALQVLKKKKSVRLINCKNFNLTSRKNYLFLENSFLLQDSDDVLIDNKLKVVTKKKPSLIELKSLRFAFNICKFVKSNAIVLANKNSSIGIGSGQPNRLDSCKIAANKALQFVPEKIIGSVAASDAFFPFPDGIQELMRFGVKAIIQPGGSINDSKVIKIANQANITMVFTGTRHFKH